MNGGFTESVQRAKPTHLIVVLYLAVLSLTPRKRIVPHSSVVSVREPKYHLGIRMRLQGSRVQVTWVIRVSAFELTHSSLYPSIILFSGQSRMRRPSTRRQGIRPPASGRPQPRLVRRKRGLPIGWEHVDGKEKLAGIRTTYDAVAWWWCWEWV